MIDLKSDYVFKYVFGKDAMPNKGALKSLISDFTYCQVNDLRILSSELKCGYMYEKNTIFDIHASFNEGKQIDIEMQMIQKRRNIQPRVLYYLTKMLSSQLKQGDDYSNLHTCYVLLFVNFGMYYDSDVVHDFGLYTDKGVPFDDYEYIHMIVVEIPKIKGRVPKTNQELWAYLFQYAQDTSKQKDFEALSEKKEGIRMAIEAVNQISQEELDWIRQMEIKQGQLEANSFDEDIRYKIEYEARQKGLQQGLQQGIQQGKTENKKEMINKMKESLSIQQIAEILGLSEENINSILND